MTIKLIWFWVKTLLVAILIAWFFRTFIIESYRVPASSMENTLFEGDKIFVNKLSYGPRFPITVLSLPFFQDSIQSLGIKSYSSAFKLPYYRPFSKSVKVNDVVVFNNPDENIQIPIDKQKVAIGRCLALPGDTLVFNNDLAYVNGTILAQTPNLLEPYYYHRENDSIIKRKLTALDIPLRDVIKIDSLYVRLLSRYETYILKDGLPKDIQIQALRPSYNLIVPKKGWKIEITAENQHIYLPIIKTVEKQRASFTNDTLRINNEPAKYYEFSYNYYWMLPDNRSNYVDESITPFIPETHLIGKAGCVWNRRFKVVR